MNYLHEGLVELGFGNEQFCGIPVRNLPELEKLLALYVGALQEYNKKFDLINTDDTAEIEIRHLLDSLSALPELCRIISERNESGKTDGGTIQLADIGSGAGLPGIPLAAALPQYTFTLVERMTKRCGFLEQCARILHLENVAVEENQAERLEQRRFDICVFRAFRPLDKKMTKVLLRILKDGGCLCAYKARTEKITEEMELIPQKPKYTIIPLNVPFLTEKTAPGEARERNLVLIEKSPN